MVEHATFIFTSTLKMEAYSSKTLATTYKTTDGHNLTSHHSENLKSHITTTTIIIVIFVLPVLPLTIHSCFLLSLRKYAQTLLSETFYSVTSAYF
jgi:signal transduction histidine kinase